MVNKILDKYSENINKESTLLTQYPLEEYDKHYKEIREMNLISDG